MGEDTTGPYGTSSGKESGQRVSVDEAARLLGVTVDAIRKRVQRETIPHQRDESGRVWVLLDAASTMQDKSSNVQDTGQEGTGPGGREILEAKDETIEALREQVAYLQGVISTRDRELALRADEIRRRDSALEREQELAAMFADRLRQLEPPRDEPYGADTASEGAGKVDDAPEDSQEPVQRRSWLYRFFFGP
jgi:hypothetical protein